VSRWLLLPAHRPSQSPASRPNPLTPSEREVAVLTYEAAANRQIREVLVITERTVAAHIEHILNELGFVSRTHIDVWAAEHGLGVSKRG